MKKFLLPFVLLVLLFTACTPRAEPTQESVLPTEDTVPDVKPTPTHISVDLTPAQLAALSALSDITGLSADKISLVSTEAVTWPDGCLGVQKLGVMCTQAEVAGFKILLEAEGKQYEFHTNQNGSAVVLAVGEASGLVEESLISQLAENLGLDKKDISVVSNEEVEFPDSCLGVAMPEVMCAQAITPGRIVVLEANGIQYEYHVNADGSRVQPATLALTWEREGGIAGFCDSMTVFLSGEIYTTSCKGTDSRMGTFSALLTAEEQDQFNTWISTIGQAEVDASDPAGVADRMVVTLSFFGNGNSKLLADDEAALLQWAQELFQKMSGS